MLCLIFPEILLENEVYAEITDKLILYPKFLGVRITNT